MRNYLYFKIFHSKNYDSFTIEIIKVEFFDNYPFEEPKFILTKMLDFKNILNFNVTAEYVIKYEVINTERNFNLIKENSYLLAILTENKITLILHYFNKSNFTVISYNVFNIKEIIEDFLDFDLNINDLIMFKENNDNNNNYFLIINSYEYRAYEFKIIFDNAGKIIKLKKVKVYIEFNGCVHPINSLSYFKKYLTRLCKSFQNNMQTVIFYNRNNCFNECYFEKTSPIFKDFSNIKLGKFGYFYWDSKVTEYLLLSYGLNFYVYSIKDFQSLVVHPDIVNSFKKGNQFNSLLIGYTMFQNSSIPFEIQYLVKTQGDSAYVTFLFSIIIILFEIFIISLGVILFYKRSLNEEIFKIEYKAKKLKKSKIQQKKINSKEDNKLK